MRWIQDPQTLELVPRDEYYARESTGMAPLVMGDIDPYKSMQTGEMIMGRRQHREHIKQHALIEIGNEVAYHMKPKPREPVKGLRDAIGEAVRHYWK